MSELVMTKMNKVDIVKFAKSITELLEQSQSLLKDASADLDRLKCDQLQTQSRLVTLQDQIKGGCE